MHADPNTTLHNPAPDYIRGLVEHSSLSQRECARRLGISERMMRYYIAEASADHRPAPYLVQFGLECLARSVTDSLIEAPPG